MEITDIKVRKLFDEGPMKAKMREAEEEIIMSVSAQLTR